MIQYFTSDCSNSNLVSISSNSINSPEIIIKEQIKNILENLLSFNNINKDLYIRSNLDEKGYIDVKCLLKRKEFKDLKLNKSELLKIIPNIRSNKLDFIAFNNNSKEKFLEIKIRNSSWNKFVDKILSVDEIINIKTFNLYDYNIIFNNEIEVIS